MKKNMFTLLIAVILFAFSSCHKISGNGPVITKNFGDSGFTSVYSRLDGDVYYTQGSTYSIEIHAQANIMDQIETHVVNGELRIEYHKFTVLGHHDRVTAYITSPSIDGLGVNGSGNLFALQPIQSTNMSLKVNGSGNVNLVSYTGTSMSADISGSGQISVNGGQVNNENLNISGSGTIDLLNLSSMNTTTHTSGSGNTTVNVSNSLDVHISGSGDVYYTGNPIVNSSISGSGKVHHL